MRRRLFAWRLLLRSPTTLFSVCETEDDRGLKCSPTTLNRHSGGFGAPSPTVYEVSRGSQFFSAKRLLTSSFLCGHLLLQSRRAQAHVRQHWVLFTTYRGSEKGGRRNRNERGGRHAVKFPPAPKPNYFSPPRASLPRPRERSAPPPLTKSGYLALLRTPTGH